MDSKPPLSDHINAYSVPKMQSEVRSTEYRKNIQKEHQIQSNINFADPSHRMRNLDKVMCTLEPMSTRIEGKVANITARLPEYF